MGIQEPLVLTHDTGAFKYLVREMKQFQIVPLQETEITQVLYEREFSLIISRIDMSYSRNTRY